MLFTYIRYESAGLCDAQNADPAVRCRFYQGTVYAEKKARGTNDIESELILKNIEIIKQNRHRGQPWVSRMAAVISVRC